MSKNYPRAVSQASRDTRLPVDHFPAQPPFTLEEVLAEELIAPNRSLEQRIDRTMITTGVADRARGLSCCPTANAAVRGQIAKRVHFVI